MSTTSGLGVCPSCGGVGPVGQPCEERVCGRHGMHFLPGEYAASDDAPPSDVLVGRRLGDYLVADLLGLGGFGRVYLALQQPIGMKVALKLLHTEGFSEQMLAILRTKFEDEARALATIQHPNVVRLLHYGLLYGRPYLVMEYVDRGVSFGAKIQRRAKEGRVFALTELRAIFTQLLDGLAAAHELGIIHRDVKPDNLMLQSLPGHPIFLRILDFGLAKFLEGGTATVQTLGTPSYMAPEQFLNRDLGPWTDLYAVGTLFFELITGRSVFACDTIPELIAQKTNPAKDPCAPLQDKGFPPDVLGFLRRALASLPSDRFRVAADMSQGLSSALDAMERQGETLLSRMTLSGLIEEESGALRADSGAPAEEADAPGSQSLQSPEHREAHADSRPTVPEPRFPVRESPQSDVAFRRWLDEEERRLEADASRLAEAERLRRR